MSVVNSMLAGACSPRRYLSVRKEVNSIFTAPSVRFTVPVFLYAPFTISPHSSAREEKRSAETGAQMSQSCEEGRFASASRTAPPTT